MSSMVGRAGEGEEEQAVVRVPRLVSDCTSVSRQARLGPAPYHPQIGPSPLVDNLFQV